MFRIKGEPVEVVRHVVNGTDPFGNPIKENVSETVENVLADPGAHHEGTGLQFGASRPEGVRTKVKFHFPKTYTESLRDCVIKWGGKEFRVIGDPVGIPEQNTPGEWNRAVDTEACDG